MEELFDIRKGKKAKEVESSDLRYIQIEDLRDNENIKYCSPADSNILCNKDDILIAWDGANAGTVGFGIEGVIGSTIARLRPKGDSFISDYVGLLLQSKFDFFQRTATGATIPHVSRNALENLEIPLPSLSEQKAIVAKLDRAQRLIDIDREMLTKYDELIQSVFLEMFGDPVTVSIEDDNTHELDELVDFKGGGTPSKKNNDFWGGDIPWVSPKDMKWTFINDSQDKITSIAIEESSTKLIKSGAVLSVVRSGILKNTWPLAINTVDVTLNQDMKALICSKKINNYFLLYYLKNYSRKVLGTVRGTTADNISTKVFKNIPIKLPEIEKQLKFMMIVKKIIKEKKAAEVKKAEVLFSSLVQGVFG